VPTVAGTPDRADRPTSVAVVVADRATGRRDDDPAAIGTHQIADEVVREVVAMRAGHRTVVARAADIGGGHQFTVCSYPLSEVASSIRAMTSPVWDVQPGAELIRKEIHDRFGGPRFGGIAPTKTGNVLVYSDPDKASKHGYDFDGWDATRQVFYYTGEGGEGPQKLTKGNKAIVEHATAGDALRLFIAIGKLPGTDTRIHRYLGEFRVDPEVPYLVRTAPDRDGNPRPVFVFRLLPTGGVLTDQGSTSRIEGSAAVADVAPLDVDEIPVAAVNAERTEVEKTISGSVVQNEAILVERFRTYLEQHDRKVRRYRIIPNGSTKLYSDLADVTANILYEAKGSAERMSVRLALGQVLDYGRFVKGSQLAVLLPEAPVADLVELLEAHDVGCVVETAPGEFIDMTSLERCP
jgi:hypothetical protein